MSSIDIMARTTPDLLPGTLDLLILRTLQKDAQHGWAISERIQHISEDVLQINQGSLYPALHRLEHQGWIRGRMGGLRIGPPRQVLPADGVRAAATGRRNPGLGTHVGGDRPRHEARVVSRPRDAYTVACIIPSPTSFEPVVCRDSHPIVDCRAVTRSLASRQGRERFVGICLAFTSATVDVVALCRL